MMKRLSGLLFTFIFIAAGIFCLTMTANEAKRCSEPAEGTVVGYFEETNEEGSTFFYPEVQYMFDKKQYTEKGSIGSGKKSYADGEKIAIMVNPENPYDFIIQGENMFKTAGWICLILGIIFLIGDIFALIGGVNTFSSGSGQTMILPSIIVLIIALIKNRRRNFGRF